jgi:hypothetical protein
MRYARVCEFYKSDLEKVIIFRKWGVTRCNVEGCKEPPTTILIDAEPDCPNIGMCETHYQKAVLDDGVAYTFEFDAPAG